MAQPHNKKLGEYPMTTRGREQGPEKRYRRLRFPAFTAAKWTAANPLLQRGELGMETDTRKIKVGDGITYWNDLEYAKASGDWGDITGDITDQNDLVNFVNNAVTAEANIRAQADRQLQTNIDNVAADLTAHKQNTNNPHNVTKAQVGLGDVDNTSDADKPVSNAQATAINNAVSTHNASETAHSNQFSQYRTSANQDTIDNQIKSDIANLQSAKADKATTLAGYGITDAYTKTEVDAKVSSVYRFRGSVATYANLPTTGQVVGDVWNVEDTGANYAWSGTEWDKLSETVDLTPYLTKADAANTYATITTVNGKQDTLTTDQLAAVNSGITADHVASYDAYAGEISAAQSTADKADNAAEVAQQTANLAGQEAAQALSGLAGKVNVAQGTANAGKILGVGDDGNVAPVDGASGAGRNIGDIFWTTRTDSALNGAVEANGAQYNFADLNGGNNNVQALLDSGALPSVSIAEFDAKVASDGGCDAFGADKAYAYTSATQTFFMTIDPSTAPGLNDRDTEYPYYTDASCTQQGGTASIHNAIVANIVATGGEIVINRLPIGDTTVGGTQYYCWESSPMMCYTKADTPNVGDTIYLETSGNMTPVSNLSTITKIGYGIGGNRLASNMAYAPENNVVGANGYFKVPKRVPRILVRCQKPTADNNYTWYNLYADGWCEQGGRGSSAASTAITFAIPMATSYYALSFGGNGGATNRNCYLLAGYNRTSTGFTLQAVVVNANSQTSGTGTDSSTWICAGYANASEYTKDKWDYQNVHVERPMVQLFNSATDEAVATCTSVLQDVANLNAGDYVIYWDSADSTDHSHAKPGVSTPLNHGWYRYYKSGWVEQGGSASGIQKPTSATNTSGNTVVEFSIPMANNLYLPTVICTNWDSIHGAVTEPTTTSMRVCGGSYNLPGGIVNLFWSIRGQAA